MPNYYAHLIFGREVLAQLPPVLRGQLEGSGAPSTLGFTALTRFLLPSYDPEFCPNHRSVHAQGAGAAGGGALLQAVEDTFLRPWYAAGFLCHFALDSCCHYYIEEQHARGLSHAGRKPSWSGR